MAIERGTVEIVISARVGRSRKVKDLLVKIFLSWAAKLAQSKIKWEVKRK